MGYPGKEGRRPKQSVHNELHGRPMATGGEYAMADAALKEASERMPGFEGQARYAAFMARTGRKTEAQAAVAEMDKRLTKLAPQFRREGRHWRDLAAKEL